MGKTFKLTLFLVNVLLALAYVFCSINFWEQLNNWKEWNMQSTWTTFYVYPYRIPGMSTVLMPVPPMLNLPFIIFLASLIINFFILGTYFLVIPRLKKWANKDI